MQKKALRWLAVFCFVLLHAGPASLHAGNKKTNKLSAHDLQLVAESTNRGKSEVTLMIAVVPGYASSIAAGIEKLNGKVRFIDADINYIRAIVPVGKIGTIVSITGVDAVKVDEIIRIGDPVIELGGELAATPPQPPGPLTPPVNAYMPTQDIGAPQFIGTHPTFDGRGVKIAIVDAGVDLLTPELQTAKTLDGTPARKIVDWVNSTDPLDPAAPDPSWINMQKEVVVSGSSFNVDSVQYTDVPEDGTYRFGMFDEGKISSDSASQNNEYAVKVGSIWCADLNRNGICHETFAVLWRTSDNKVWVDTNADRSFSGEAAMTDYKVNYDMGIFGTDNPVTPVRESIPFVVQTNGKDKFVNIGVVAAAHGTHVAGIAAGKGFFGGGYNGAAPEAQIIAVRACPFGSGCTTAGMMEGMIYAAKRSNADVINMSIGGLPALNDGKSAMSLLFNRLIEKTKAQIFISAGNAGPGANTVADPSVASLVMSVGASVTKDTWYNNYGVDAARAEGLFAFSSRGPSEEGGFKPNIVAPGSAVSTIPAWQPAQTGGPYTLPPGYAMGNGTSMAAPEATGGAALLISAAKQTGAQFKPVQLRQAINSSARYLQAYMAHEQGNGVFQIENAWTLLQNNIKTVDISSKAPVKTILSDQWTEPNTGTGIYQREGWQPGDTRVLNITLTRTKGSSKPATYKLMWTGNDGTFRSATSVSLPRDVPVTLPVTVNPVTTGIHSAILNLIGDPGDGFVYQIMNTVVAAEQLILATDYTASFSGSADRPEATSFFINVPPNVQTLKLGLTPLSGTIRQWVISPEGVPYGYTSFTTGAQTVTLVNPMAGVYEIAVETSTSSAASPAVFTQKTTLQGFSIDPPSWTIDNAQVNTSYRKTYTFSNQFASFTGGARASSLNSIFETRTTLTSGQTQYYDIIVPSGTMIVSTGISNATSFADNVDLFLYDCTAGENNCVLKASGTTSYPSEYISSFMPKAGLWRAAVVPVSLPSGNTQLTYTDTLFGSFGTIACSDPPALRIPGASWSREVTVTTPLAAPAPGRFLQGQIGLYSGSDYMPLATSKIILKFDTN